MKVKLYTGILILILFTGSVISQESVSGSVTPQLTKGSGETPSVNPTGLTSGVPIGFPSGFNPSGLPKGIPSNLT